MAWVRSCNNSVGISSWIYKLDRRGDDSPSLWRMRWAWGRILMVSRRLAKSFGRTLFRAIRVAIRSISEISRQIVCSSLSPKGCAVRAVMAWCRSRTIFWARSGWWTQWRNRRLPIGFWQSSNNDNSVGSDSPRRVWLNSKLRRVAASIPTKDWLFSRWQVWIWGKTPVQSSPWVCAANAKTAPTAQSAGPYSDCDSIPIILRSCIFKTCCKRFFPSDACQIQVGSCCVFGVVRPVISSTSKASWSHCSGKHSHSAGEIRARCWLKSFNGNCAIRKSPLARVSQAMPTVAWSTKQASRVAFWRSSKRPLSINVPGVRMRTTCRSTGPLLVAGSPICSHTATLCPAWISLLRYCSAEWYGTPAILIVAPLELPRWVSVISRLFAATIASSKNSS